MASLCIIALFTAGPLWPYVTSMGSKVMRQNAAYTIFILSHSIYRFMSEMSDCFSVLLSFDIFMYNTLKLELQIISSKGQSAIQASFSAWHRCLNFSLFRFCLSELCYVHCALNGCSFSINVYVLSDNIPIINHRIWSSVENKALQCLLQDFYFLWLYY